MRTVSNTRISRTRRDNNTDISKEVVERAHVPSIHAFAGNSFNVRWLLHRQLMLVVITIVVVVVTAML